MSLAGCGHGPHTRHPVKINELIRGFVERLHPAPAPVAPPTWTRAASRPRRALYLSSPIGLGHARRDLAIARALRTHHPDLQIDWLAQHPVTRVLADRGERVHPASRFLASESAHVESEAAVAREARRIGYVKPGERLFIVKGIPVWRAAERAGATIARGGR